jgi:hypothetical protein
MRLALFVAILMEKASLLVVLREDAELSMSTSNPLTLLLWTFVLSAIEMKQEQLETLTLSTTFLSTKSTVLSLRLDLTVFL